MYNAYPGVPGEVATRNEWTREVCWSRARRVDCEIVHPDLPNKRLSRTVAGIGIPLRATAFDLH